MSSTRFQKTPAHYLQYLGLKGLCIVFSLLPYRFCVWLGTFVVGVSRLFLPKRFKRMQYDIHRAFPEKSPQEVRQIAINSWRNMGTILAEFIQLSHTSRKKFKEHCRVEGFEKIQAAEGKTGGIIHIGHFTNWEAFGFAASVYGADKAVLALRADNPYIDEEMNRLRNVFGGRTFYSNHQDQPFFACMRWLKKKKLIGILIDQNASSSQVWIPFMGRIAAFSPISALLAIKMQVPVFPVQVHREADGMLVCHIKDPLIPPTEYNPQNVRLFTRQLIEFYETCLKEDPASWLWAHNLWKRDKEGEQYLAQHPEEKV